MQHKSSRSNIQRHNDEMNSKQRIEIYIEDMKYIYIINSNL